jgi:hypothetical protein
MPSERPELAAALSYVDGAIQDLEMAHAELQSRLYPVLRPETGAGSDSCGTPSPVRCLVSTELESLENRIRGLRSSTLNLLQRLAV